MEKRHEDDIKHVEEEEDEKTEPGVILSQTRVKRIIKSDPDTKQIANNAAYLIGRATVRNITIWIYLRLNKTGAIVFYLFKA